MIRAFLFVAAVVIAWPYVSNYIDDDRITIALMLAGVYFSGMLLLRED